MEKVIVDITPGTLYNRYVKKVFRGRYVIVGEATDLHRIRTQTIVLQNEIQKTLLVCTYNDLLIGFKKVQPPVKEGKQPNIKDHLSWDRKHIDIEVGKQF